MTQTEYLRARRAKAIEFLGGACQTCGLTHTSQSFFDIDHKLNNGAAERRLLGPGSILTQVFLFPERYQLLCPNCHREKTIKDKMFGKARIDKVEAVDDTHDQTSRV